MIFVLNDEEVEDLSQMRRDLEYDIGEDGWMVVLLQKLSEEIVLLSGTVVGPKETIERLELLAKAIQGK